MLATAQPLDRAPTRRRCLSRAPMRSDARLSAAGLEHTLLSLVDHCLRSHPHGLSDAAFDSIFTGKKPANFAFEGYPWLVHRLTCKRTDHDNFHVHGYQVKARPLHRSPGTRLLPGVLLHV